ncbi:amidase [Spelaeicoccus albus]|uniref:Aspartyl-tRNA(Asn)/glutamyl-tRNA(Gln) amidotransferase subunit A n=1 Tax=Spelaeicoccus albus TaxID=1280376 RepID=A0A7Z0D5J4_9MICO|nr:amidase [Spelaeicoccus albus]NYI69219.1 aspartyl-tRNA(Asn)/glutamyl-tRNA(Gln) amidotransferase subunit A [Spelaeicoccus albus]
MTNERDLAGLSAADMTGGYAAGTLSPVEVADAVLARVGEFEPVINAFYVHDPDAVRRDALASADRWRAGTPRGVLDGVPVTVKENVARRGVGMPSGNAGNDQPPAAANAPITDRIEESGGVIVGSTTMPDWGMLSSGVSSLHGITRSPIDPKLTTGGSSAGAGAAAAAGYGPVHVGSDIGGSIRLPGTWLGLATLKPSYGRVALDAPYLGRCAGPLARRVDDLAVMMSVIGRPDVRDYSHLPAAELDWTLPAAGTDGVRGSVRGLKIGVQVDAGCGMAVDPEIAQAVTAAADLFAGNGAAVSRIEPFMSQRLLDSLDRFWRVRSWVDYQALTIDNQRRILPYVADWCRQGADVSGAEVLRCYQDIMRIRAATIGATKDFDLVLSPVSPVAAFPAEWPMPFNDPSVGMAHIGFAAPYNMSEQPAASVNCGFTSDGRTIGLQIAGRRFADPEVLRAAAWYESARPESARQSWPD